MKTEELKDQIIVKYKELTKIYEDYVVANEIEGYNWESDFKNPVNKVLSELEILKQQLLQAELEPTKPCNNCKYSDLAYDEYPCFVCYDGLNKSFDKWEPVKAMAKIEEKQESFKLNRCKGCGFPIAIGNNYCSECMCEDDCAPD